ncbi:hypothetical protein JCM8547_001538 [Rhodosporidiobolus lusitaniae]
MPNSLFRTSNPPSSSIAPGAASRLSQLVASSSSKPSSALPPSSSSFLSKLPAFPLFPSSWAVKDDDAQGTASRDRRFSFGAAKGKGRADHPPSSNQPLKRSKSARTSLIATAKRLSTQKRPKDFPPISRPVLEERNGVEQPGSFMHDYRDRAPLFAMSSPELATPAEEKEEQWAAFPVQAPSVANELPHSPMVKWDPSANKEGRSYVPLSPTSARPFSASSSTPSADSYAHFSEPSTASSTGPDTPLSSSSPTEVLPFRRARSPRTKWEPPLVPSLSPPPLSPVEPIQRAQSQSPANEEEREANRAEALAKLTSPTPTGTRFPDDLTSFPFPPVDFSAPPAPRSPPPRPTRPPPALPNSGTSHSLILPLPSSRPSLDPEDPTTPPPLTRSNTVGLHPSPVPLDIDFKGRLIRARNSHPNNASPSLAASISSFGTSSPPNTSRFSDWGPPSGGSRKSSETSLTMSIAPDEREEGPWPPVKKGGLYALATDMRLVESAVDVLAIVEEDETPYSSAPPVRVKRSPSKQAGSNGSPARRPSAAGRRRISFEPPPSHGDADVLVLPRTRIRPTSTSASGSPSKPARPYRLSAGDRTLSSGVVTEPTRNEQEEYGLRRTSLEPFPLALKRSASPLRASSPQRQRTNGKRCLSELHVEERSMSSEREKLYGLGLGLPSSMAVAGGRTRHESLAAESDEPVGGDLRARRASRRISSGSAVRTKLVLREKGKATLTYQLGECIGRGQFGSVYRALNLNNGQVVACKRISLDGKADSEIEQLSNEVGLLQRLAHPSVVKYEGVIRTENYLNIILEFAEGGSLQSTLKQYGQLPETLVATYVVKILEGLSYLHSQNVVHCDLKAANILSTKNGNIKLSDFGVSLNLSAVKATATKGLNPGAGEANGTPNWMAPEIIQLEGPTSASDIWSLAATICELIDGKPPYADLVAMSAMFRIVEDDMPPIPERCSEELKTFLRRCFRKNPKERPSAEELVEDPWVVANWSPDNDNMRPQDSLPFLRRLSTEYRRPTLNFPLTALEAIAVDSDNNASNLSLPLEPPAPSFAREDAPPRGSMESGYRASTEMSRTPEPSSAAEEPIHEHQWNKSTFSRPVGCATCGEDTRRHSALCVSCGMVVHRRCRDEAAPCRPFRPLAIPLSRTFSVAPSATVDSPASAFSIGDFNPFSKAKRPKPSQNSSTDSGAASFTALRNLSQSLLPIKTRTPEHTPPASLSGKSRPISISTTGRPPANDSQTSLAASPASPLLTRKLSRNVVVENSAGNRALGKKKSHGRSLSQPVQQHPKQKEGDCVVM